MREAVPPLTNTPSWRGAQFKKSTGTTLPLPSYTFLSSSKVCSNTWIQRMYFGFHFTFIHKCGVYPIFAMVMQQAAAVILQAKSRLLLCAAAILTHDVTGSTEKNA